MSRSLALKWIATLLLTSLIGVVLVGLSAYRVTADEFERLRLEQAGADFADDMTTYYQRNGSWEGLERPQNNGGSRPERGGLGGFDTREWFALADIDGRIVFGHGRYEHGMIASAQDLALGMPITVDGVQVGTAMLAAPPPGLSPIEQGYIDATNRALLIGAIGAAAAALLVGVLLSRGFLRQLRELTRAISDMRGGDLKQEVPVYSKDELGELARAFNRMSADLHRANDLRDQMTADIAHELRTPLTVISGYIEGLTDGTFKPTPARFEAIGAEVALLRRLVDDLRTLSLADAGKLKLIKAPVMAADLMAATQKAFEALAAKQGVRLHIAPDAAQVSLPLDRERILQVLSNLTSNALRYTPSGGTVTLQARQQEDVLELRVQDTGAGIAPEHLPNIFERFYRASASRSDEGESGLGLAIVRSIVQAHGGSVRAESVMGQGTTMVVELPLR